MLDGASPRVYLDDVPTALLDKDQTAERLNIGRWHLERLIRDREIPFVKVGRLIRFKPDDIDAWLDEHRIPADPRVPRAGHLSP